MLQNKRHVRVIGTEILQALFPDYYKEKENIMSKRIKRYTLSDYIKHILSMEKKFTEATQLWTEVMNAWYPNYVHYGLLKQQLLGHVNGDVSPNLLDKELKDRLDKAISEGLFEIKEFGEKRDNGDIYTVLFFGKDTPYCVLNQSIQQNNPKNHNTAKFYLLKIKEVRAKFNMVRALLEGLHLNSCKHYEILSSKFSTRKADGLEIYKMDNVAVVHKGMEMLSFNYWTVDSVEQLQFLEGKTKYQLEMSFPYSVTNKEPMNKLRTADPKKLHKIGLNLLNADMVTDIYTKNFNLEKYTHKNYAYKTIKALADENSNHIIDNEDMKKQGVFENLMGHDSVKVFNHGVLRGIVAAKDFDRTVKQLRQTLKPDGVDQSYITRVSDARSQMLSLLGFNNARAKFMTRQSTYTQNHPEYKDIGTVPDRYFFKVIEDLVSGTDKWNKSTWKQFNEKFNDITSKYKEAVDALEKYSRHIVYVYINAYGQCCVTHLFSDYANMNRELLFEVYESRDNLPSSINSKMCLLDLKTEDGTESDLVEGVGQMSSVSGNGWSLLCKYAYVLIGDDLHDPRKESQTTSS